MQALIESALPNWVYLRSSILKKSEDWFPRTKAIQTALQRACIEFMDEDGVGKVSCFENGKNGHDRFCNHLNEL